MEEERLAEFMKEARRAKKEDLEFSEAMERLVRNSDFQLYQLRVMGSRIESFGAELLVPSGGVDGMVKSEFVKGAMYAFCLARDMPSVIIKSMSEMKSTQENEE